MPTRRRTFSFPSTDLGGVVDEMAAFARDADGRRWLNVVPDADESEIPTGSSLLRVFTSRGPVIPKFTWVPGYSDGEKRRHDELGFAHPMGKNVIARLAAAGVHPPSSWRLIQDHQKRGVVFGVDVLGEYEEALEFAMSALRAMSPFEFEDAFLATFSER